MLDNKKNRIDYIIQKIDKRKENGLEITKRIEISHDMYCGSLNLMAVQDFVCILCFGIAINPLRCYNCETLICYNCIGVKKFK